MSRHQGLRRLWIFIVPILAIAGCASKPRLPEPISSEDIYRHRPEDENLPGAKNIQVETTKDGSLTVTAVGNDSHVASIMPLEGGTPKFFPDTLGTENLKIAINKEVGYTEIAGLRFKQEATINIRKDGVIEVDKDGVEASDKSNSKWISKKVKMGGEEKPLTIMVRNR